MQCLDILQIWSWPSSSSHTHTHTHHILAVVSCYVRLLKDPINFLVICDVIDVNGAHEGHFPFSFNSSSICCILKAAAVSSLCASDLLLCLEPVFNSVWLSQFSQHGSHLVCLLALTLCTSYTSVTCAFYQLTHQFNESLRAHGLSNMLVTNFSSVTNTAT